MMWCLGSAAKKEEVGGWAEAGLATQGSGLKLGDGYMGVSRAVLSAAYVYIFPS